MAGVNIVNKNGTRRVSYEQVRAMIDFMGQNIDFATGSFRTMEARHTSKRLWKELATILNNVCRVGTVKTADEWSRFWSIFKNRLKSKDGILKEQMRGALLNKRVGPLTKLEKRALVILGPHFEKNTTKVYDQVNIPPEVKQEKNNDFDLTRNDSNDSNDQQQQQEESSGERESSESEKSGNEDDEVDNEEVVHNIYPKWLIEVEKKRADAELLRATAEEKRARAATKNAEASVIQAEALKKLADAAAVQANAIGRIAAVLENRRHSDDMLPVSSIISIPGYPI